MSLRHMRLLSNFSLPQKFPHLPPFSDSEWWTQSQASAKSPGGSPVPAPPNGTHSVFMTASPGHTSSLVSPQITWTPPLQQIWWCPLRSFHCSFYPPPFLLTSLVLPQSAVDFIVLALGLQTKNGGIGGALEFGRIEGSLINPRTWWRFPSITGPFAVLYLVTLRLGIK